MANDYGAIHRVMPSNKKDDLHKLKPILIWVISITLGIIIFSFLSTRRFESHETPTGGEPNPEASLSMEGIRMVSTRDGNHAWDLVAQEGHYLDNSQQAVFKNITVFFHQHQGGQITLKADNGVYRSESNDLELSGHVVIENNQYHLESAKIDYIHKQKALESKAPVSVKGKSIEMAADSMAYIIETDEIMLKGKITGTILDDITL